MRIALVDLLFCWPPHGGADVDCFNVASELQAAGHTVHLFGLSVPDSWERGAFTPDALPFPASRVTLEAKALGEAPARLREAVAPWGPEVVLVGDGFFLKPLVINALEGYPLIARYYAHEAVCHRDILRFKDGAPCPNDYLHTRDVCRHCAFEHLGPEIRRGLRNAWLEEYLAARAHAPEYHAEVTRAMRSLRACIVYNAGMGAPLRDYCADIVVVPGGVDLGSFAAAPPPVRGPGEQKVVLMSGRAEDPVKGVQVLLEAGERLRATRGDFLMQATLPLDSPRTDWFEPIGWQEHAEMRERYLAADVCVVPSVWQEPFGLVAVEAMACGRPVCASRVGGLQHIVTHGETGFVFAPGDSGQLAEQLGQLLDNASLRAQMGAAGWRRVETEYTWKKVVEAHYLPLLERLGAVRSQQSPPSLIAPQEATPQTNGLPTASTTATAPGDSPQRICAFYSRGPHYVRVLKRLRKDYPHASITAVVPAGFPAASIETHVDHIQYTESSRYSLRACRPLLRLLRQLRAPRYDLFIVLFDSTRLRLIARASGAPRRQCITLDGRAVSLHRSLLGQLPRVALRHLCGRWRYARVRRSIERR